MFELPFAIFRSTLAIVMGEPPRDVGVVAEVNIWWIGGLTWPLTTLPLCYKLLDLKDQSILLYINSVWFPKTLGKLISRSC